MGGCPALRAIMVAARWLGMEQGVTCASLGFTLGASLLAPAPFGRGVAARFASLHLLEGFAHEQH
ncbi:hypothetical protein PSX32_21105 [Shigella flexneri]|nr:hypothetical protein [Shigella flexneri]